MTAAEMNPSSLIAVESAPAVINVNFDEVKARLSAELERYDVVVTAETLPEAKKLATELNKNASEFDKRRKDAVATVSGPIKVFEGQMKELVLMCKKGRQDLINQIDRFETETKALVLVLLETRRSDLWAEFSVDTEFRRAVVAPLVKLTALTKKGRLTAKASDDVAALVAADKQLQDQTKMRLVMLENQSFKAGLTAPLARGHVETFLFADDDLYQEGLGRVMEAELARQKEIEAATQRRIEQARTDDEKAARRREEVQKIKDAAAAAPVEDAPAAAVVPTASAMRPAPEQPASAPVYEQAPISAPAPEVQAPPVADKHAFGLLDDPRAATIEICTREDAESKAQALSSEVPAAVWVPGGLVAIAYRGELFRKV